MDQDSQPKRVLIADRGRAEALFGVAAARNACRIGYGAAARSTSPARRTKHRLKHITECIANTHDQRKHARRLRWGERAAAVEGVEMVHFHVARIAQTVRQHIDSVKVQDETIDALMAR